MAKTLKSFLIALTIILIAMMILIRWSETNLKQITAAQQLKIENLKVEINTLKDSVSYLKIRAKKLNNQQAYLEQQADSLKKQLEDQDLTCPQKVHLLTRRTVVLESALSKCNKVKAIQVHTIAKLELIVQKTEPLCAEKIKLVKVTSKKEKHRAFYTGAATGAGIILIAVIILL